MSGRIHHIDVAKGISIILVVANHSAFRTVAPDFFVATSLLRLPLFFFLSGIFFSAKSSGNEFVLRKADALLKPYFITLTVMWLGAWLLFADGPKHGFSGVFYGSGMTIALMPIWFLPHLFLVHVFAYLVIERFNLKPGQPKLAFAVLVIGFLAGVMFIYWLDSTGLQVRNESRARVGFPFSSDVLPMSLSFFLAGYLLRSYIVQFKPDLKLAFLFLLLYTLIGMLGSAYLDFNGRILHQPLLIIVGAMMGVYLVLTLSCFIATRAWMRNIFIEVGQAGLIILIFHSFFVGYLYRYLLPTLKEMPEIRSIAIFAIFLLGIAGPLAIRALIVRSPLLRKLYLPIPFRSPAEKAPMAQNGVMD